MRFVPYIAASVVLVGGGCCLPMGQSLAERDPGDPTPPVLTIDDTRGAAFHLTYSPDGNLLAAGATHANSAIRVWDAATGEQLLVINAHAQAVAGLAFSPDGSRLISASWDGTIKIWDADSGELLRTIQTELDGGASSLAITHEGDRIACGGRSIYTPGKQVDPVTGKANPNKRFCPIKIWDLDTGEMLMELALDNTSGAITSLAFSPDGSQLVSGSNYGPEITVWRLPSGEILHTLSGHDGGINSLAYSPDGHQIASGSYDRRVKIWSAKTGNELLMLGRKDVMGRLRRVDFSPDGKQLATASGFGVHVWDLTTGRQLRTLKDLNRVDKPLRRGYIHGIGDSADDSMNAVFSPNGRHLACTFGKIIVWEME